jgi:hypothetical protein
MSSQHPHPHGELVNENVHHEESDINIRAIITFVVVLTVVALAIHAAMYGLFKVFDKIEDKTQPTVSPLTRQPAMGPQGFPEPRLQQTPWTDLRRLRTEEGVYLHSYGWVDESAGVARIPIDKAKAMLLQKGLPVRPEAVDAKEGTRFAATGESSGGRNLIGGEGDKSSGGSAPASGAGAAPIPSAPGASAGGNPPPQAGKPVEGTAETKPGAPKKPGGGGE